MRPLHRPPGVTLLVAVLALVAACSADPAGGSASTGTPTASPTPVVVAACALVTPGEAAAALGQAAPPHPVVDTAAECHYPAQNGVDSVNVAVRAEEYVAGTEDAAIAMLGADKANRVSGLGEAAVSYDVGHQVQYHIWVGGQYLLIVLTRADGGDVAGPARTLAETAAARTSAATTG